MVYQVKEIYFTLQGEGANAGRGSVFCRFSGCNLWSGREEDRRTAKCWFCDTDFVGTNGPLGAKYPSAEVLAETIDSIWPQNSSTSKFVVFTGGEPLLQLDEKLISAVKKFGFEIAVETNGTIQAPQGIDWITVSPKPNSELIQREGSELKLVYPHDITPESVEHLPFKYFMLSPLHSADKHQTAENTKLALNYCLKNPRWRLTMQYHKIWGIP